MGVKRFGIDISRWQKENFSISKAMQENGVEFVICRAGGGDGPGLYTDRLFNKYYNDAVAAKCPVGAYFYGNAFSVADAKREAEYFLNIVKGKQLSMPLFYDVEGQMLKKNSRIDLTNIVYEFCKTVEEAGYWIGIYSSTSAYNNNMVDKSLARFSHWVAHWGIKNPPKLASGNETQMWQESSSHIIQGRRVDTDYCFVDYPKYIKAKGLNGFPKPVKKTTKKE